MTRTGAFVLVVGLLAGVAMWLVHAVQPVVSTNEITAVAVLAALALIAETLTFVLPRSAQGSIAFIPYLAAVMVVPAWPTLAAAAAVKFAVETLSGREALKKWFNVAQLAVSLACAILAFRLLGGVGMLVDGISTLAGTTVKAGLPALVAFVVTFVVNALLVQGVIAISNRVSIRQVLRENVLASIGFDLLASPIVFLFAWLYAESGAIAAFAVWVPILGFRQLTKTNLELEQTNQELLELMVKSIEARDAYTSGHSRRVARYSTLIAQALRLNQKAVQGVQRAALLHDVGKIHEKYAPILAKPDRLSPDEWITMQQHPIDGAELVMTMTRLRDLVPAIRHHHERWDGTGYPDRLRAEEIPLAARIIALADTIDAMTSERPYRPALDETRVRRELEKYRGQQFDPEIVDRLLADQTIWTEMLMPGRGSAYSTKLALVKQPALGLSR